jgi:RNA polymerase sigma-70 factor (ECF subfamily)
MQSVDELVAAFEAGRAAWPGTHLDYAQFARFVGEGGISPGDLAAHGGDLYLACACAMGEAGALRTFDERFVRTIDVHLARYGVAPEWVSEVQQKVRLKLFLGQRPGIRRYRAQGALGAFVRVTAVRVAVDVAAAAAALKKRPDAEILDALVATGASPEVHATRALYGDRFRAAIEEALASLSKREKTIMRLHFVDGLNIEGIGSLYGVHRATVARWLVAIRGRVVGELRARLSLQFRGTPSELRSLVQLLREDVDLSARRILGGRETAGARDKDRI